jgi:CRISPR/Cas system CSM-associated protein Csm4 (group 5 of RAMP superfamily)
MIFKRKKKEKFIEQLKYGHLTEDHRLQKKLIKAITDGDDDEMTRILKVMVDRRAKRVS